MKGEADPLVDAVTEPLRMVRAVEVE